MLTAREQKKIISKARQVEALERAGFFINRELRDIAERYFSEGRGSLPSYLGQQISPRAFCLIAAAANNLAKREHRRAFGINYQVVHEASDAEIMSEAMEAGAMFFP